MLDLSRQRFDTYPELARGLLAKHLDLLRRLPIPFASLLLREAIHYDWKFPMERRDIESNLTYLSSLQASQLDELMKPFRDIQLPPSLASADWVADPIAFSEKLTAHLWATHQIDSFRSASVKYMDRRTAALPPPPPAIPRATYVMVGEGAKEARPNLFRKLRPHGTYFTNLDTKEALPQLLQSLSRRVAAFPAPFAHWYIDGGQAALVPEGVSAVSYGASRPVRALLQQELKAGYERRIGSEQMRSNLAQKKPEEFGLRAKGDTAVLDRFTMSILTDGSGTQIYSTAFVQWTVREALRRAQPLTMLVRFRPRQRERPMQELLTEAHRPAPLDPEGSLVDAEMGAYYSWINEQRLPGAEKSSFLALLEGGRQAVAIGPAIKKGVVFEEAITVAELADIVSNRQA